MQLLWMKVAGMGSHFSAVSVGTLGFCNWLPSYQWNYFLFWCSSLWCFFALWLGICVWFWSFLVVRVCDTWYLHLIKSGFVSSHLSVGHSLQQSSWLLNILVAITTFSSSLIPETDDSLNDEKCWSSCSSILLHWDFVLIFSQITGICTVLRLYVLSLISQNSCLLAFFLPVILELSVLISLLLSLVHRLEAVMRRLLVLFIWI